MAQREVETNGISDAEPWFSVEQIAKHLGVSKETIYRWLEKQKIPARRVGKLWRFRASTVDEWVLNDGAATPYLNEKLKKSELG